MTNADFSGKTVIEKGVNPSSVSSACFIGVDVGSASVRAGVFDSRGQRLAFAVRPISQFHPRANVVEQSSAEIWQNVCAVIKEAVALSGVAPQRVRSIGFDATCSLVVVGAQGQRISVAEDGDATRDIIMWMDHRAAQETADINATGDDALRYVGGEVSIEMELPKVLWLKRHFPERYRQAWRLFDLADYLVWRATGADVASVCTLTCKWNYLAHEQRFSQPLLQAVGLDDLPEKIPTTILDLGVKAGQLQPDVALACGLNTDVAVASGMIDAHAGGLALVGSQPEGSLALISGTSNCHMLVNREPVMVPGVWGPYWGAMLLNGWLSEGGQSAAGALVEWTLRQHASWTDAQQQAEQQGISVYTLLNHWVDDLEQREPFPTRHLHVLADHHGNRSPRATPHARGAVYGLTLEHGPDALARLYLATLQAIAYGTRHIIDSMNQAGHQITRVVMCGGATKNPLWLREYANITGCDIHLASEEQPLWQGLQQNALWENDLNRVFQWDGVIQPTAWESSPGHVHVLMRSTRGQVYRSDSDDYGRHWRSAYATALPNNNSGIDVVRTPDGSLVLVFNPITGNWNQRYPLSVAVSRDNGEQWEMAGALETENGEFSYPAIVCQENALHITYTWNRTNIIYQKINIMQ